MIHTELQKITFRQAQVLQAILDFRHANGVAPSIRQIGTLVEPPIKSPNGVIVHLRPLIRRGWLKRGATAEARTLTPLVDYIPADLVQGKWKERRPEGYLDLEALQQRRESISDEKSDLFDFYNGNWDVLVAEIHRLRAR